MVKFKIGRSNSLKETIQFNLVLCTLLTVIPYALISILAREIVIKDIKYFAIAFILILVFAVLEFNTRKYVIFNKLVYLIYWVLVVLISSVSLFYTLISLFAIMSPLKWG